jgi:hypothetical protein
MTPTERLVALVGVLVIVAMLAATALARLMAPPVVIAVPSDSIHQTAESR